MKYERFITAAIVLASLLLGFKYWELQSAQRTLLKNEKLSVEGLAYEDQFIGKRLPDVSLPDVISSSPFRIFQSAYELVFLFSATDCEPCLLESLQLLVQQNQVKKLSGNLIAVGHATTRTELLKWRKISHATFPFLFDEHRLVENSIGADRKPLLLLIDPHGRIVAAFHVRQERLKRFSDFLERMISIVEPVE